MFFFGFDDEVSENGGEILGILGGEEGLVRDSFSGVKFSGVGISGVVENGVS